MIQKVPISVIILTYNEEANIEFALRSVNNWAGEIIIVDSYSTDRTLEIASNYTDKIYQNTFIHYADQRNWALQNLSISQEWVLFLDADEVVTTKLKDEIIIKLKQDSKIVAFELKHLLLFLNKPLKYANLPSPHVRLVKKNKVLWHQNKGAMEKCTVEGKIDRLRNRLLHNNRKGVSDWIKKHDWYSTEEANFWLLSHPFNKEDTVHKVYKMIPLFFYPFVKFFYIFFLRLGFLDGKAGFAYIFLHDFWLPMLVYVKLQELKNETDNPKL